MLSTGDDRADPRIAVCAEGDDEELRVRGMKLAGRLGLPWIGPADRTDAQVNLLLVVTQSRLELRAVGPGIGGAIFVDFVRGPTGYRRRSGRSRDQAIGRAVGLRSGTKTLVDATAGLGRDAFLLACLGCRVTAIERSPVLAALVRDGIERVRRERIPELDPVLDRITLVEGDARELLTDMATTAAPDVVYLDPMYAPAKRSALAKKEMRILRRLVGDDPDAGELLAVARKVAAKRVVVKRHRHAPPLAPKPALMFQGRAVRYDVYLPASP